MGTKRWYIGRLWRNEKGAALVEYSILLGIIVVLSLSTFIAVANWIGDRWTALNTQIQAAP